MDRKTDFAKKKHFTEKCRNIYHSVNVVKNKMTVDHLLTGSVKSIQTLLSSKNNETLQIIDFARFLIRLEFPPSDLDRIQTCNLLSRNQMRYSVAPRGRFNDRRCP